MLLQSDLDLVEATVSDTLTESHARSVAGLSKQILLTFVNRIRLDFAITWAAHVRQIGLSNYLVGATDQRALRSLRRAGVPCFGMRTRLPEGEWAWGSQTFKALGQHKIELIYQSLSWGLDVVITDVDALVLRDPFAYVARWPDAGFLSTSDHLSNTTSDGGLEDPSALGSAVNIGYMFFRPSALPLVSAWRRRMRQDPRGRWDQGEFSSLVQRGRGARQRPPGGAEAASDPRLFRCFGGRVLGGILPATLFSGGHHYFVSQLPRRMGWQPYSIHTTYQYGGAPGKRHRLREAGVWIDPAAYYDPPGAGLLAFEPDVPEALVRPAGGMDTRGHTALMTHQLRALRGALALASTLGRRLVLPPLTCGYDKYWGPLSAAGVIPGAPAWAVPIAHCPLDHLLNPAELRPSAEEWVREWSFLDNPRTPAALLASARTTRVDPHGGTAEVARLRAVPERVLRIDNLAAISTGDDSWSRAYGGGGGLLTPAEWATFEARFASLQGGWCCAPPKDRRLGMPNNVGFHILQA